MPKTVLQEQGSRSIRYELGAPVPRLDLTSDPWTLDPERDAVLLVGADVVHARRNALEGGRRPVGTSIPLADRPLVAAWPCRMYGSAPLIIQAVYNTSDYTGAVGSLQKLTTPYAWSADVVGGIIVRNEDERHGAMQAARITARSTTAETNDTIAFSPAMTAWTAGDAIKILYDAEYDKRGILATNGRKFWLLAGGAATLYLDLGSDDYLGVTWHGAQIANGRFMFVAPGHAPRILDLSGAASATESGLSHHAGLLPPGLPVDASLPAISSPDRGIYAQVTGHDGTGNSKDDFLTQSESTQIYVRAINEVTGAESEMVRVTNWAQAAGADPGATTTKFYIQDRSIIALRWLLERCDADIRSSSGNKFWWDAYGIPAYYQRSGDKLIVTAPAAFAGSWPITVAARTTDFVNRVHQLLLTTNPVPGSTLAAGNLAGHIQSAPDSGLMRAHVGILSDMYRPTLPRDTRWTHLEVWRSNAAGTSVYLEARIAVNGWTDVEGSATFSSQAVRPVFLNPSATYHWPCRNTDAVLSGFLLATTQSLLSGALPPACRRVMSLQGVTLCAGKASGDAPTMTAEARSCYVTGFSYNGTAKTVGKTSSSAFENYELRSGDTFVATAPAGLVGEYPVASVVAAPDYSSITITCSNVNNYANTVEGYIKRTHTFTAPQVRTDEQLHHSRTDKFAPESFMRSPFQISNTGDSFQAFAQVGRYAVVLMRGGVYLIWVTPSGLEKEDVSTAGDGTPWPDSLVVLENVAMWATPRGVRTLTTFPPEESDEERRRGKLGWLDAEDRYRAWFEEAYADGDTIDAGVDAHNTCLRFRRRNTHFWQVLQINYKTGAATLLDDDSGLAYASSRAVESSELDDELLYSVTEEGATLAVNDFTAAHPYDGATVQDVLDDTYTITDTSITKTGAFDAAMLGDVVRIYSSVSARNGLARRITAASADAIEFAAVTGLAEGDEFVVGAVRYRYKSPPMLGDGPESCKTLETLRVEAVPGDRAGAGDWPDPPEGKLTCRLYRDYQATALDEESREIPIYDADDVSHVDKDRVSLLQGQGSAIQVEVESVEAKTDFRIVAITPRVREDGSLSDASTTE